MSPEFGSFTQNSFSCNFIPGAFMFDIVEMKFILPNRDEIPLKCKANIARSTLGPLWLCIPLKGG